MKNELYPLKKCPNSPGIYEHKLVDEGYIPDNLGNKKFKFHPELSGKIKKECGPIIEISGKLYSVMNPSKEILNQWFDLIEN